jgi:hypothetical protein
LQVLASRDIGGAGLVQVLTVAGMFAVLFLGSLYLRRILGYDPLQQAMISTDTADTSARVNAGAGPATNQR